MKGCGLDLRIYGTLSFIIMFVGLKFLFRFDLFKTTDGLYLSLCVVDPTVAGGL